METRSYQSNALHPNELGRELTRGRLDLGRANMVKLTYCYRGQGKGETLVSQVECELWSSVGTLEGYGGI